MRTSLSLRLWCENTNIYGDLVMSDNPNPNQKPLPSTERRVEPFLDCLAFLLAKRWLREQRQSEENPPQNQHEE